MYNPADEISSIDFGSIIGGSLNAVINAQKESAETTVDFVKRVGFKPGEIDAKTGNEIGVGDPICVSFAYDKEVSPSQFRTIRNITVEVKDGGKDYTNDKPITFSIEGNEISGTSFKLNENGAITEVVLTNIPSGSFIKDGVAVKASQEKDDGTANTSASLVLSVTETEEAIPALYQKMQIDVPILTMMPIPFIKIDHTDIEFNVKINSVSNSRSSEKSNTNVNNETDVGYKGWGLHASTNLKTSISNQKTSTSGEEVKKDYSLNIKVHAVQDDMPAGMSRILDILEDSISTKAISQPAEKSE